MSLFQSFHQVGVTVLIATHAHAAEEYGARTLNLVQGELA
jgi:ABC-type ATPase involved in cell division